MTSAYDLASARFRSFVDDFVELDAVPGGTRMTVLVSSDLGDEDLDELGLILAEALRCRREVN